MTSPFTDPRKGKPYWLRKFNKKEVEHHRRLIEAREKLVRDWREGTIWEKKPTEK